MIRAPFLLAAWRTNRMLPLLLGGLMVLNVAVFLLLTMVAYPRQDAVEQAYIALQGETRRSGQVLTPQQAFQTGQEELQRFGKLLPERRNFADLVGELYQLAGGSNLQIERIAYDRKEIADQRLFAYALTFSVTGSYGELKRFIYELEQSPRLLVLEKIDMRAANSAEGETLVGLDIKLTTYFRSEGAL